MDKSFSYIISARVWTAKIDRALAFDQCFDLGLANVDFTGEAIMCVKFVHSLEMRKVLH